MKKFLVLFFSVLLFTGCDETTTEKQFSPEAQQFARVQILNAFSATDSAIRAVAFESPLIDSINDDRGSKSNGIRIEQMRGWSIVLKDGIKPQQRANLLSFLHTLESAFTDLNSRNYGDVPNFNFTYEVIDRGDRIDVQVTGNYGME